MKYSQTILKLTIWYKPGTKQKSKKTVNRFGILRGTTMT